jgi:hypothetical protein
MVKSRPRTRVADPAHRIGVVALDPDIDGLLQRVVRERTPAGGVLGDLAVDAGQRDRVEDLPGAPHDRRDHRRAEVAGQEPGRHFGEPIAQRHRQPDLPQRPAMTDRQRARHLRRGGVEVITGPPRVLALAAAAAFQLGDRRQLAGLSGRRSPPPAGDRPDQRHLIHASQIGRMSKRTIEHTFDYASGV